MAKELKWSKDAHGNVFDIRNGQATFIISKKEASHFKRELTGRFYGTKFTIPFSSISSAKKCAEIIYNG